VALPRKEEGVSVASGSSAVSYGCLLVQDSPQRGDERRALGRDKKGDLENAVKEEKWETPPRSRRMFNAGFENMQSSYRSNSDSLSPSIGSYGCRVVCRSVYE
jgi:hypothetical protein